MGVRRAASPPEFGAPDRRDGVRGAVPATPARAGSGPRSARDGVLEVAIVGGDAAGLLAARALVRQRAVPVTVAVVNPPQARLNLVRDGAGVEGDDVDDALREVIRSPDVLFLDCPGVGGDSPRGGPHRYAGLHRYADAVIHVVDGEPPTPPARGTVRADDLLSWSQGSGPALAKTLGAVTSAVIVGSGPSAIRTARLLAMSRAELRSEGLRSTAVRGLASSPITDVHVIGSCCAAHAMGAATDLAALDGLAEAEVILDPAHLGPCREGPVSLDPLAQANLAMMRQWVERFAFDARRHLFLTFGGPLVEVMGRTTTTGVILTNPATGELTSLKAGLVVLCDDAAASERVVGDYVLRRDGAHSPEARAERVVSAVLADAAALLTVRNRRGHLVDLLTTHPSPP